MRERAARDLVINTGIVALIGVLLAILGPFGTYEAPLALRLAYWVGTLLAGQVIFLSIAGIAGRLADQLDMPEAFVWGASTLVGAVPMTFMVALANRAAFRSWPASADSWLGLYGLVFVVAASVSLVMWLRMRPVPSAAATTAPPAPAGGAPAEIVPLARLLARVAPAQRSPVLALESEDHYVRVHMAAGSALLLMRLRDAIAEMDGAPGAQVHRSWWVARDAVTGTDSRGRTIVLKLQNGTTAPVARNSVAELERLGWL